MKFSVIIPCDVVCDGNRLGDDYIRVEVEATSRHLAVQAVGRIIQNGLRAPSGDLERRVLALECRVMP